MAILKTPKFTLEVKHTEDCADISINSFNYSGKFGIYCLPDDFRQFVLKLKYLYGTLREGEAGLEEVYERNYLSFKSDGLGHFIISGEFNDWGNWNLKFSESIDQTYLKDFVKQLSSESENYKHD